MAWCNHLHDSIDPVARSKRQLVGLVNVTEQMWAECNTQIDVSSHVRPLIARDKPCRYYKTSYRDVY